MRKRRVVLVIDMLRVPMIERNEIEFFGVRLMTSNFKNHHVVRTAEV